jgi:maleate cis-trans isomerase
MSKTNYRIGQIVPSSNTTMETEIPAMLRAREAVEPERFTFHSSRMRMQKVTKEELEAMDRDSDRCAVLLADARVEGIEVIDSISLEIPDNLVMMLKSLGLKTVVPNAGALLSGKY